MSEEIKREGELNEAALEGVSGGDKAVDLAFQKARDRYCLWCDHMGCGHSVDLAHYMVEHGDIRSWRTCPFYGEA